MKKQYLIIPVLAVSVLVLSGCTKKEAAPVTQTEKSVTAPVETQVTAPTTQTELPPLPADDKQAVDGEMQAIDDTLKSVDDSIGANDLSDTELGM